MSEDTIWEVTTAWQDALSSQDLKLDDHLLKSCSKMAQKRLANTCLKDLSMENLEKFSENVSKLILCSAERIENSPDKLKLVDNIVMELLHSKDIKIHEEFLVDLCSFIEILNGNLTINCISDNSHDSKDFEGSLSEYLKYQLFILNVIMKLSCYVKEGAVEEVKNVEKDDENETEEEDTDDYCDVSENLLKEWPNEIFEKFLDVILAGSISDVLILNSTNVSFKFKFKICVD